MIEPITPIINKGVISEILNQFVKIPIYPYNSPDLYLILITSCRNQTYNQINIRKSDLLQNKLALCQIGLIE
jgi:hypothetical protein